jgi:RND family efflux transporter MFP subunit
MAQAQAAVDQARAALAKLQQPADADEVAQARASATSAQAALDELTAGPTATALETALAAVKQAEAARDAQRLKLDQMTLTAPFAGVVAAVAAVPGQPASSSTITLVDDSTLMIDVSVAENDIAEISLGQPVRATFSALPDQTITGTVTAIAPKATVQSNVVSYPMTVALDAGTTGVKTGMTASVAVVTGQAADVLSVPNRAIQTQGQQKVVTLQRQGQTVSQPVQVGLVGDSRTEIAGGLTEGDTVVIAGATTTSTTTRSPQISTGLGIPGTSAAPKP